VTLLMRLLRRLFAWQVLLTPFHLEFMSTMAAQLLSGLPARARAEFTFVNQSGIQWDAMVLSTVREIRAMGPRRRAFREIVRIGKTRHIPVELAVVTVAELPPGGETMGREQMRCRHSTGFNSEIAVPSVKARITIVRVSRTLLIYGLEGIPVPVV
jgi:hypothetical protein